MGTLIEPDFSCLVDEIAEPCPDMNIKVAAFTVSEKSTKFLMVKLSDYSSVLSNVLCAQKNHLNETVLLSSHNNIKIF